MRPHYRFRIDNEKRPPKPPPQVSGSCKASLQAQSSNDRITGSWMHLAMRVYRSNHTVRKINSSNPRVGRKCTSGSPDSELPEGVPEKTNVQTLDEVDPTGSPLAIPEVNTRNAQKPVRRQVRNQNRATDEVPLLGFNPPTYESSARFCDGDLRSLSSSSSSWAESCSDVSHT